MDNYNFEQRIRDVENSNIELKSDMKAINDKLDDIKEMLKANKEQFVNKEYCKMKEREMDECFKQNRDLRQDIEITKKDLNEKLDLHIKEQNDNSKYYIRYTLTAIIGSIVTYLVLHFVK